MQRHGRRWTKVKGLRGETTAGFGSNGCGDGRRAAVANRATGFEDVSLGNGGIDEPDTHGKQQRSIGVAPALQSQAESTGHRAYRSAGPHQEVRRMTSDSLFVDARLESARHRDRDVSFAGTRCPRSALGPLIAGMSWPALRTFLCVFTRHHGPPFEQLRSDSTAQTKRCQSWLQTDS